MSLRSAFTRLLHKNKIKNFTPILIRTEQFHQNHDKHEKWTYYKTGAVTSVVLGSVLIGTSLTDKIDSKQVTKPRKVREKQEREENVVIQAGEKRPDLPTYRAEEVSKHDSLESFWVTYRHGVYDVTKFIPSHPGGEQILNAAGYSIEPFWNVYGMHKTQEVYKLLESFRIGNLHDDDIVDHSDEELWATEPVRDKRLIVKTARPFNAEVPPQYQVDYFDTPNELFYVRQHMPVPQLDSANHQVTISIVTDTTTNHTFSLQDLSKFKYVEVRAALMCAGNRRSEMDKQVKPVKGISWAGGAISNAVWGGVYLRDVLLHCGVDLENTEGKHIIFYGSDIDATGVQFSTSVPLAQAAREDARALLATHMNGKPLPPDHGAPLRFVLPGAPAVRSVKWLQSIRISEDESPSHWHQKDYRSFNASTTWETADFSTAPPVYSLPVTSAICDPPDGSQVQVEDGCVRVRGYAYSGGGARILRVDVSADAGRSWTAANLRADAAPPHTHYSWTLWALDVPVDSRQTEVELWVKATDSNFNTQPENFDHIWNIRGILSNAYHKIKVKLQH